jgi:hypothetical protein
MAATNQLSVREENEICVAAAGELADDIENGKATHQRIREYLKECVAMYGIGYPDDFFVEKVVFRVRWNNLA